MSATFDYRELEAELAEDEAISKTRPVLLTQREIAQLFAERKKGKSKRTREEKP